MIEVQAHGVGTVGKVMNDVYTSFMVSSFELSGLAPLAVPMVLGAGHETRAATGGCFMLCRWIIGLSASLVCAVACFGDQSLSQNWVGELKIGDTKRFVQLGLDGARKPVTGTIAFPASGRSDIPLSDVSVDGGHVKFAWAEEAEATSFDGTLSAGLLEGTVRSGDKQGTLQLAPTVKLTAEAEQQLIGYYEMRPGHVLSVLKFPAGPVYSDYTTGQVGVLFPSSGDSYFAGSAFQVPVPMAIHCRLSTDPAGLTALHWQDKSGEEIGRKLDQRREEVTFRDRNVVLSGTLVLPTGKGPHPALIRIQGAGPQTRAERVRWLVCLSRRCLLVLRQKRYRQVHRRLA